MQGYTKFYKCLMSARIPDGAKIIFCALLDFLQLGLPNPKIETLAKATGKTRRTVFRDLAFLRQTGMIQIHRAQRQSSTYEIAPDWQILMCQSGTSRSNFLMCQSGTSKGAGPYYFQDSTYSTVGYSSSSETFKTKAFKKKTDDDEQDKTLTPEQVFTARLVSRHGPNFDAALCIGYIQRRLDGVAGLRFGAFVEYDASRTTGHVRNPMGYYQRLAADFVQATLARKINSQAVDTSKPDTFANQPAPKKCAKCGGGGQLHAGGFCDCAMGRDLARALRQPAKPEDRTALALRQTAGGR